jgi:SapC
MTLHGFQVIDGAKFNALPDDVFLEWRRRGWLPLVYCHFLSMDRWRDLAEWAARE